MSKNWILGAVALIGALCLGIGVYMLLNPHQDQPNDASTVSIGQTTQPIPTNQDRVEVTLTGKDDGVRLAVLKAGENATISYLSGKIISNNKTGFTSPIWGVPLSQTDSGWIPLMPYAKDGMWTNAIFVDTGDKRIPFKEGQYGLKIKNDTTHEQTLYLRFHEARGYFFDNEGDARFEFKKEIVTVRQKTWQEVKSGRIPAAQQWTDIGTFEGKIKIQVSGAAVFDPRMSEIRPAGINEVAPAGYTLVGANQYGCLINHGKIEFFGSGRELLLDKQTSISLGGNEDMRGTFGNSFSDNSGAWEYKVYKFTDK